MKYLRQTVDGGRRTADGGRWTNDEHCGFRILNFGLNSRADSGCSNPKFWQSEIRNFAPIGLWILVSLWLLISSCGTSEPADYQIKGQLSNSSGETVSLVDVNASQSRTIDSVKVNEDGSFYFTKKVPEKGFYTIQTSPSNFATLIIDSTEKIIFTGNARNFNDSSAAEGSVDTKLYSQFNDFSKRQFKQMEESRNKQDSIRRVFEAYMNTTGDTSRLDSLSNILEPVFNRYSEEYKKLTDEFSTYIKKFVDDNTTSFASLAAVQMLSPERDIEYFSKVSDALTAKYPAIKNLEGFRNFVNSHKKLAIGSPPPEISMNDPDNKPISLSSLKGKVVLVDFWASWCKPCRAENPFVVSLYDKYKSKGFDIFSVSLDFNKEAWLNAIAKDKLVWKSHVTDLLQWQSKVIPLYGITSIPFTVVLDKQGNIAAKNLRGPELEEKIRELLL